VGEEMTDTKMPKNFKRNFRFVGLLDSAKTAHPVLSATGIDNWWMPEDEGTHQLHCAAAEVMTIKQVLMGEIIQLPRNQSFDSPAWLHLADFFVRSKLPLFSICVLDKQATPGAFLNDCAQQFEPTTPFALSAWPDLTAKQREIIANNIRAHGNFTGMFDNLTIDSHWITTFEKQQEILQKMLIYLMNNYKSQPGLIRSVKYAKTTTWSRIERDYTDKHFISKMKEKYGDDLTTSFQSVLGEIKLKVDPEIDSDKRERWLSTRTNLFKEIHNQPRELREILRAAIDRSYVETTSESVTGIGRFVDADRSDTERSIDDRISDSLRVDAGNDPAGLREFHIIEFENLAVEHESIDDFLNVLNDKGIAQRIMDLRDARRWGIPTDEFANKEKAHIDALCQELPHNVIWHNKVLQYVWAFKKLVVNVSSMGISDLIEFMDDISAKSKLLDEQKEKEWVSTIVFKKRQETLAGILRDWLTKEIKIDDRKRS